MIAKLFINLPVKDITKSVEFYVELGFAFNMDYADEHSACMELNDTTMIMLLSEERFKQFSNRGICDTQKYTEVRLSITVNSRKEVDDIIAMANFSGGVVDREPQDHGWIYGHSFIDLDGHQWEVVYLNTDFPSAN
jgi:predicted lactoylglutathione lyase